MFATVGSEAEKKFLLATFTQLQEDHIGDSRSLSFEGMVRNVTKGKGVPLLLNSLSDEKLQVRFAFPPSFIYLLFGSLCLVIAANTHWLDRHKTQILVCEPHCIGII